MPQLEDLGDGRIGISRQVVLNLSLATSNALNLIESASVLLRPRPSTMRADDRALRELAREKLDKAAELLRQALQPW